MDGKTVFKIQHSMLVDGVWMIAVTDLIFRDGQPLAVLAWGENPDSERPQVFVKLDPSRLQELRSGNVTHLYDGPIEDPREAQKTRH
jgi:hypothetical protein